MDFDEMMPMPFALRHENTELWMGPGSLRQKKKILSYIKAISGNQI